MSAAGIGKASALRPFRRESLVLGTLGLALLVAMVTGVCIGALGIPPGRILAILGHEAGLWPHTGFSDAERAVLLSIRLPRVVFGAAVGAGLAVAGAALQGLFRNPLADPGLIGVSSGAALAAVGVIVLGVGAMHDVVLRSWALPPAAFAGGILATLIVYRIARRDGVTDAATMLLAGVAINAIASAGIGALIFLSDDQQLRDLNFWLLGGLGGATWSSLAVVIPGILLAVAILLTLSRFLNVMLLGEGEASNLGFDVERGKRLLVLLAALVTGFAVALAGIIGFVGLVVPHLIRLAIGPDHRLLLPAAALLGATLMVFADIGARMIVLPAELPIGIVTACVGGPFFLWLLVTRRQGSAC